MVQPSTAFTLEYTGIANALITDCHVSVAFDPSKTKKRPEIVQFKGLWDTGATNTVISKECAKRLGLQPTGRAITHHANGSSEVNTYFINLYLPNKVAIQLVKVTEGVLNGFDVLIGMNIITLGDFSITNPNGKTKFSFTLPSTHDIDYVRENKRAQVSANGHSTASANGHRQTVPNGPSVHRNDPCHCGSGKKFKFCCASKPKV